MSATPAQVANDMDAWARFYDGRDKHIERMCRQSSMLIRQLMAGERIDGRTWGGLYGRIVTFTGMQRHQDTQIVKSLDRAKDTIEELKRGVPQ